MKVINHESLIEFFDCHDSLVTGEPQLGWGRDNADQEEAFAKLVGLEQLTQRKMAVLGIDIYKYSQYREDRQIVIPFVFQQLLKRTFKVCLATEPFLFQRYRKDTFEESLELFLESYIDTGDGGFLIFETPLHAVLFALYFEGILRNFNSRFIYEKLNCFVDSILLRYAITYDTVYRVESKAHNAFSNHYGTAIINCARVLSRDRLNRCLIDAPTNSWFLYNTNGIETLTCLPFEQLAKSADFEDYTFELEPCNAPSFCLPSKRTMDHPGIHRADVLKIGEIKAKTQVLSVYNLQLQFSYQLPFDSDGMAAIDRSYFTATLGNLNTEGIV